MSAPVLVIGGALILSLIMPDFSDPNAATNALQPRPHVVVPVGAQPQAYLEAMPTYMPAGQYSNYFISSATGVDPVTGGPVHPAYGWSGPGDEDIVFPAVLPPGLFEREVADMPNVNYRGGPQPAWRGAYLNRTHPGMYGIMVPASCGPKNATEFRWYSDSGPSGLAPVVFD
jgi:hypothetical protein